MKLSEIDHEEFDYEIILAGEDYALLEHSYIYLGHGDFDMDVEFTEEVRRWTWENCRGQVCFQPQVDAVRFVLLADAIFFKLRWS